MAVWGGLTNSCEKKRSKKQRRKGKIYKHLNAGFQRIARRDKKAFFSDQCKDIEENNRMGKTRDLFKKIREGLSVPRAHTLARLHALALSLSLSLSLSLPLGTPPLSSLRVLDSPAIS